MLCSTNHIGLAPFVRICSDLLSISLKIKHPDSASQQLGPYITSHRDLIFKLVSECFSHNAKVTVELHHINIKVQNRKVKALKQEIPWSADDPFNHCSSEVCEPKLLFLVWTLVWTLCIGLPSFAHKQLLVLKL